MPPAAARDGFRSGFQAASISPAHFREEVTEDNHILFNYRLYSGRSNTRNALKLLRMIGYSSDIVKRAEYRLDKFLAQGVWEKKIFT